MDIGEIGQQGEEQGSIGGHWPGQEHYGDSYDEEWDGCEECFGGDIGGFGDSGGASGGCSEEVEDLLSNNPCICEGTSGLGDMMDALSSVYGAHRVGYERCPILFVQTPSYLDPLKHIQPIIRRQQRMDWFIDPQPGKYGGAERRIEKRFCLKSVLGAAESAPPQVPLVP